MKKLPKYLSILSVSGLLWAAFLVPNAFAQTDLILTQNVDNTVGNALTNFVQQLPVGANGVVNSVAYVFNQTHYVSFGNTFTEDADIIECTIPDFTFTSDHINGGCTGEIVHELNDKTWSFTDPNGLYYVLEDAPTSIILQQSKFYYLRFRNPASTYSWTGQVMGTNDAGWSGSTIVYGCGGSWPICGDNNMQGITAAYFDLFGSITSIDQPTITNISPEDGSVTASTTVRFQFDYTTPLLSQYQNYYINVTDNGIANLVVPSSQQAISTFTLSGNVIAGTPGSVALDTALLFDHVYSYKISICTPLVLANPCYTSSTRTFSVVNGSSTTAYLVPTSTVSTSSLDLGPLTATINALQRKPPISWFIETIGIFNTVTKDATSSLPIIDINMQSLNLGSTTPFGNVLPDLKITSSTILTYMGNTSYNTLIALQDLSYILGGLYYLYRRITGIFRAV